ncbi:MAG: protein-(glutamine-N5) methyltransferase, release factor-specific [Gallionellales bacterium RBG_16_56_9]|nr:MAG: protein-(glutamine-N5) methyltransferase, release factor-specific [Gallionellales bacterium RBG_16_56_9]
MHLVLAAARQGLKHLENPAFEVELLLAHAMGKPRSYLLTWPEYALDTATLERFESLIERRAAGIPAAYLMGCREFWSLELAVTHDTLIPRPETERLVELALPHIPEDRPCCVADLGTGSGAIALAIASERPHCHIIATDISEASLAIAQANASRHRLHNVEFRRGDWLTALRGDIVDVIVSNPPYIHANDPHIETGDLPHEPRLALVAGNTGLEMIETIAQAAMKHLSVHGWLLLEHGYDQAATIVELLHGLGYCHIQSHKDTAGIDRVIQAQRN